MTLKEYYQKHDQSYSICTGKMGEAFYNWYEKKIDGTEAILLLKKWYKKGSKVIEKDRNAVRRKNTLERCLNFFVSAIRDEESEDKEKLTKNQDFRLLLKKLDNIAPLVSEMINKAMDKHYQEPEKPIQHKLIKEMIEESILSKDGKTPYKSLNDIALFIVKKNKPLSMMSLLDLGLRKKDGTPYGNSAYQKAIHYANTYNPKLENGKKMHK